MSCAFCVLKLKAKKKHNKNTTRVKIRVEKILKMMFPISIQTLPINHL